MGTPKQPGKLKEPVYSNGKQIARHIFHQTMAAIDVGRALRTKLKFEEGVLRAGETQISLGRPPRIVALGKASNRMALVLNEILGGRIESGVVVAPAAPVRKVDRFRYFVGGHPYPNAESLAGARAALDLVSNLAPEDAVIFLVSGGGSALFELPLEAEITLHDLLEFNQVLVTGELPIEQINVLRKHISAVKGGRLALRAFPARQLTVYISDVPPHYASMVASGPTMPDESTLAECYQLAEDHHLTSKFPHRIRKLFEERGLGETPKAGEEGFSTSQFFCLLSNQDAVESAKAAAERAGFICEIDANLWDADFMQVANQSHASLQALRARHPGRPVALVVGGEVTCPVTGTGTGGRNQSFVLYAAQRIAGKKQVVLSAGTDGRDGNSPACGAVADGQTKARAADRGFDPARYLADSDAYHFFRTLGDTLNIGFTDNNVRDVRLFFDFD